MNQITRSIVGASVLLNGILIATIVGAFPFFLFLSLVTNLLMFLQARKLLEEVNAGKDDMEEISTSVHSFSPFLYGYGCSHFSHLSIPSGLCAPQLGQTSLLVSPSSIFFFLLTETEDN